jgi:hypothetical protein
MNKKRLLIAGGILSVPILALAWWLGSPLFFDSEVNEDFPVSASAEEPDVTSDDVTTSTEPVTAAETQSTEEVADDPASPIPLLSGDFEDVDSAHRGSGTATIYQLEDGSHVLRLEDFEVTNGPDLHVLLAPTNNPDSRDAIDGYIDLGSLKGNIGDQNYELPPDVDPAEFGSVVIYCEPFHVIFSTASLS